MPDWTYHPSRLLVVATSERSRRIVTTVIARLGAMSDASPTADAIQFGSAEEADRFLAAQTGATNAEIALAPFSCEVVTDLVVLNTGELALVTLRRAPGASAPHGVRRWSERLGRLLREEGIGEGRFRGAPDPADPRVAAVKGAMGK